MHEPPPPEPAPVSSGWTMFAAVILALQGLSSAVYSGFLPGPDAARVGVPLLGTVSTPWIALGILAMVAAWGVYRRRAWGRVLGIVSEALAVATGLLLAPSSGAVALVSLLIPFIVLFALWRRWPAQAV